MGESSNALARQIENWLNAKLKLMDLTAQNIASNYRPGQIERSINSLVLKGEFIMIFGSLVSDGTTLKNLESWKPRAGDDGRTRPWYAQGKAAGQAVLTEPWAGHAFLLSKSGNIMSYPKAEMNGRHYSELSQIPGSSTQVRESTALTSHEANQADHRLQRQLQVLDQLATAMHEMSSTAEEQSATTEEINRNTTNIRDISHEVAAGAEEQVRQCALMGEQVQQQSHLLGRFNV